MGYGVTGGTMIPLRSLFLRKVYRACLTPSSHTYSSNTLGGQPGHIEVTKAHIGFAS